MPSLVPSSPITRQSGIFVLSCLLLAATAFQAKADVAGLTAFTERGMGMWHVPGMAVAVVSRDEIQFSQGFGQTATVDGQAVDEHTLFAIASTTKAMVVSGVLMLVDEGKVSLDEPIIKYIPELHFAPSMAGETIRVRDLLAHRTGLPSTDFWTFFQGMPLDEQITRLQNVNQEAPVRSRLIYQNTMFEIAGLLIERLSGERWDLFLKHRLWQPAGMNETYGARGQIAAGQVHVMPHYYTDDKLVPAEWDLPADSADAAGSVWSSLHDMSLWAQFLLRGGITAGGERLITEASFADMFEPQQLAGTADFYPTTALTHPHWRSYGLAWFQQDFQGRKIDFHTGSLGGLIALIGLDRENDRAVIILANRDHAEMRHAVLWEVMDNSAADKRRDWNQEIFNLYAKLASEAEAKWQQGVEKRLKKTNPALAVEAYVGTYRSKQNGDLVVEQNGRKLGLKTKLGPVTLQHWQLETFLLESVSWNLRELATFHIGSDAAVSSLEVFGDTFVRVKAGE